MFRPFLSLFPARTVSFPVNSLQVARNKLTNQKRFYCFTHKPIRTDFLAQFPRALLAVRHAQKRRALGSRMVPTSVKGVSNVVVGFLIQLREPFQGSEWVMYLREEFGKIS